jgi:hypothetical protein
MYYDAKPDWWDQMSICSHTTSNTWPNKPLVGLAIQCSYTGHQSVVDMHTLLCTFDLHCFWQVNGIISWQLLGIGLSDMRMGLNPDSLCLHPISSGAGISGTPQWAFFQTIVWLCTRIKWTRRTSLVGGSASVLLDLANRICLAASTESVVCTPYILLTNNSEDLMVSSVRLPMPKFVSN